LVALSLATLRPIFRPCLVWLGLTDPHPTKTAGGFPSRTLPLTQQHLAHPTAGKGYVAFDKELELEGIAQRMGNESHVESGQRRGPMENALGKGDSFRLKIAPVMWQTG